MKQTAPQMEQSVTAKRELLPHELLPLFFSRFFSLVYREVELLYSLRIWCSY